MSLTVAQKAFREGKIGASFVPILMGGNAEKINNEWKLLIGDPSGEPLDLSDVWAPSLGSFLEPFVLSWHERKTGRALTRRGESVGHPTRPYVSCTLDAFREDDRTTLDCKVIGHWQNIDNTLAHYAPQLIVQRACTDAERMALVIVHGGAEPVEYPVEVEPDYERQVWERIDAFWACVESLTPPFPLPAIPASLKAERIVDMAGSNSFASEAAAWLANKEAKALCLGAEKALKEMVPADAARCHGFGIAISRNKAGSLSLRELKP